MATQKRITDKSNSRDLTSINYANPIAIALGRTLENLRVRANREADDLAKILGLKYPTYRLIETGSIPLRPSRSLMAARVHDLDWQHLAIITVVVQAVEDQTASIAEMKDSLQLVCRHSPQLESILYVSDEMWVAINQRKSLDELGKIAVKHGLVAKLEDYIKNDPVASADACRRPERLSNVDQLIDGIAPYYLEILKDVIQSFQGVSAPTFQVHELAAFEARNTKADRFTRIYGVTHDAKVLGYSLENQRHTFNWGFLLQQRFEFLGIIILTTGKEAVDELRDNFRNELFRLWKQLDPNCSIEDCNRAFGKVCLSTVSSTSGLAKKLLEYIGGQTPENHNNSTVVTPAMNLWLYRLQKPTNTLACVDNYCNANKDVFPFATSCSSKQTADIANALEEYWVKKLADRGLAPFLNAVDSQS